MARTMLQGLARKGADIKWLCQSVCGAATKEGSRYYQTRRLSSVAKECSFHSKLSKELPRVDTVNLPVVVRKKLVQQQFSALLEVASNCRDPNGPSSWHAVATCASQSMLH